MNAAQTTTQRAYAKIIRRFLPFLSACFVLAYLDRLNIGFAKFQLTEDLHLSDTAYGLGAGVFFLGYLLVEVPGNRILTRIGARAWISRIMIVWGIVCVATAFVHSPTELYVARFFLGAAEAGFFPGVIFYLTQWFPDSRRAHVVSFLISSIAIAGIIGGPLAGIILQKLAQADGLRGWQWLFILEGIPSVLAGIAALFILDDTITDATWLSPQEKALIAQAISRETASKHSIPMARVFADARMWFLGFIYFCFCMGLYGVSFWLPQLLKNAGAGDVLRIGLLSAIPYGVAIPAMSWIARRSDAGGNRYAYIYLCAFVACVGLTISALHSNDLAIALSALTLATVGILAVYPLLWAVSTAYLSTGNAGSAGIAVINSLGASAGFFSPYIIGMIRDATKSTTGGMLTIAASVALGGVLTATWSFGNAHEETQPPRNRDSRMEPEHDEQNSRLVEACTRSASPCQQITSPPPT
jgi:sugar phosphate permease